MSSSTFKIFHYIIYKTLQQIVVSHFEWFSLRCRNPISFTLLTEVGKKIPCSFSSSSCRFIDSARIIVSDSITSLFYFEEPFCFIFRGHLYFVLGDFSALFLRGFSIYFGAIFLFHSWGTCISFSRDFLVSIYSLFYFRELAHFVHIVL